MALEARWQPLRSAVDPRLQVADTSRMPFLIRLDKLVAKRTRLPQRAHEPGPRCISGRPEPGSRSHVLPYDEFKDVGQTGQRCLSLSEFAPSVGRPHG